MQLLLLLQQQQERPRQRISCFIFFSFSFSRYAQLCILLTWQDKVYVANKRMKKREKEESWKARKLRCDAVVRKIRRCRCYCSHQKKSNHIISFLFEIHYNSVGQDEESKITRDMRLRKTDASKVHPRVTLKN
jgi:hypothetical protein